MEKHNIIRKRPNNIIWKKQNKTQYNMEIAYSFKIIINFVADISRKYFLPQPLSTLMATTIVLRYT